MWHGMFDILIKTTTKDSFSSSVISIVVSSIQAAGKLVGDPFGVLPEIWETILEMNVVLYLTII